MNREEIGNSSPKGRIFLFRYSPGVFNPEKHGKRLSCIAAELLGGRCEGRQGSDSPNFSIQLLAENLRRSLSPRVRFRLSIQILRDRIPSDPEISLFLFGTESEADSCGATPRFLCDVIIPEIRFGVCISHAKHGFIVRGDDLARQNHARNQSAGLCGSCQLCSPT